MGWNGVDMSTTNSFKFDEKRRERGSLFPSQRSLLVFAHLNYHIGFYFLALFRTFVYILGIFI